MRQINLHKKIATGVSVLLMSQVAFCAESISFTTTAPCVSTTFLSMTASDSQIVLLKEELKLGDEDVQAIREGRLTDYIRSLPIFQDRKEEEVIAILQDELGRKE